MSCLLPAGCRSAAPAKRPVDELISETLQFAAAEQSRATASLARRQHGASVRDANLVASSHSKFPARQAAYEERVTTVADEVVQTAQPIQLVEVPAPDATGPSNPVLPSPIRTAEPIDEGTLSGPLVNEIFEETDIRHAIQSLATQAKASVIIDEQIGGTATAIIEDEPFESALQKILLPLGYVWEKRNGEYFIGTTDPESSLYRFLSQKLDYRSQHFSPEELTALLPERMKQYVRVVGKRNLMVIDAPRRLGREILAELQHVDQPVPQVVIEAVVAVFSPETSFQYGVNLKQMAANGQASQLDLSSLALSGTVAPAATGYLFHKFAHTQYFLRLLEQEGYVKIRAAPHVTAKDGEKADISIARETFFATQPVNPQFYFRQEIQKVEAGIRLQLTPVIRGDNITVTIERAEVSEDIRESGTDPDLASPYPLINRRTIETTVNVKDGETIVIGGLTQNQIVDRVNRVPFFSSIPIFGHLFKQIDKQEQEAEIVIFISPRIVYPGSTEGFTEFETPLIPPKTP